MSEKLRWRVDLERTVRYELLVEAESETEARVNARNAIEVGDPILDFWSNDPGELEVIDSGLNR